MVAQHNRMQGQGFERATETMQQYREMAQHSVEEYPLTTLMTAFAVGLSLGAAIGCALSGSSRAVEQSKMERMWASLAEMMPEQIQRRFS